MAGLTTEDIDQIAEGIEHFVIGVVDPDPEVADIWQPYIDQLLASRTLLAAASDLLASLREFVALYDGVRDSLGPSVREKLRRADAAIAKAEQ